MTRNARVVPAILTDDPVTLQAMVHLAESFTDYVQFDIMDGIFVLSRSITAEHLSRIPIRQHWEAHLMVPHPQDYLDDFRQAGARRIIFHYEAASDVDEVITVARGLGLEVGLAINPETSVARVLPYTGKLDCILFMSVNPGYYGAKFLPEVMDKIVEFRKKQPHFEIGIDGGVKEDNISMIARAYLKQGLDEQGSRREVETESVECSKEVENGDKRGV